VDKLLGHHQVRQRFVEALQSGRLHHAWLLYGVKGIGKATLAEKLSGLFFCESPDWESQEACGQCHPCAMLHAKAHPDFQKMELLWDSKKKKFNRDINIAQTRDALGFLSLSGLNSRRRVLLIDDANLMNNQAANALLKGLEEPTSGSLLFIVCHDLMRLPATIRSRCMMQACAPLNEADMKQVLSGYGMDDAVQQLAVDVGLGSPGRIEALREREHAKALIEWQSLIADLARSDIARIQQWLDKYVKILPHDLIASMLILAVQPMMLKTSSWKKSEAMHEATLAVASWPKEVVRHTLRPSPSLLSYVLQLRNALKTMV